MAARPKSTSKMLSPDLFVDPNEDLEAGVKLIDSESKEAGKQHDVRFGTSLYERFSDLF